MRARIRKERRRSGAEAAHGPGRAIERAGAGLSAAGARAPPVRSALRPFAVEECIWLAQACQGGGTASWGPRARGDSTSSPPHQLRGGPRRCAPPRHRSDSFVSVATDFVSDQSPRVPRSAMTATFCKRVDPGEGGPDCAAEPKLRGHDRHVAIREPFAHLPRVSSRRTPSARAAEGRVPARLAIIKRSKSSPEELLLEGVRTGSWSDTHADPLHSGPSDTHPPPPTLSKLLWPIVISKF